MTRCVQSCGQSVLPVRCISVAVVLFLFAPPPLLFYVHATLPARRPVCTAPSGIAAYNDAAAAAGGHSTSTFLGTLVHYLENRVEDVRIRVTGKQAWLDTWATNIRGEHAEPFVVTGLRPWWRVKTPLAAFTCAELARVFGELKVDYQLHGMGQNIENIDEMQDFETQDFENTPSAPVYGEKMSVFARHIASCGPRFGGHSVGSTTDTLAAVDSLAPWPAPRWFSLTASSHPGAWQLWQDLGRAGFSKHSPVYLEGVRFDDDAGELLRKLYDIGILVEIVDGAAADNNEVKDVERVDGTGINGDPYRYPIEDRLPRNPLNNPDERYLRGTEAPTMLQLPANESLHEVFLYAGDKFSGTFLHQHGSGCSMMSADTHEESHLYPARLWLLYSPERYCALNRSLPEHLPLRCPSMNGNCIEGLHPLDVLQHFWELRAYGLAPMLHLQKTGELFCFPEGYYHGTVNLGPSLSLALVLRKRKYTRNTQCIWDDTCAGEDGGFDQERCDIARQTLLDGFCGRNQQDDGNWRTWGNSSDLVLP